VAARADALVAAARHDPGRVLTPAVRRVLEFAPASLAWTQLDAGAAGAPAGAWEAVADAPGGGQDLYSINILDGTVLLNGAPPGRLPRSITAHPFFVRTFGANANFEVAVRGGGAHQTSSPVHGRFYRFQLLPGATGAGQPVGGQARLVVIELDPDHGVELELLECGAGGGGGGGGGGGVGGLAAQLPPRLVELHSHWLSRERRTLVLRPPSFLERTCGFIARLPEQPGGGGAAAALDVRRVPPHLRARHWTALASDARGTGLWADLPDRLVLPSGGGRAPVLSVLAKLEDAHFIHVHAPTARPGEAGRRAGKRVK
jgi:hypothetical protein